MPAFETRYSDRQRNAVIRVGVTGKSAREAKDLLAAGQLHDVEGQVPAIDMPLSTAQGLIRRAKENASGKWTELPVDELREDIRRRAVALTEKSQTNLERQAQRSRLDPGKLRSHLSALRELDQLLAKDHGPKPIRTSTDGQPTEPTTPASTAERIATTMQGNGNAAKRNRTEAAAHAATNAAPA